MRLNLADVVDYNGMVISFEQRFTGWGSGIFQANYTYGHALDELSNGGVDFLPTVAPPFVKMPTIFEEVTEQRDARHSFNANYVWELPIKETIRDHGPDGIVKGWHVSGTIITRTGFPYTTIDFAETGNLVNNKFFGTIFSVPAAPLPPAGPCGKGAVIPASASPCLPTQVLGGGSPNPGALFVQTGCESGFNTGNLPGENGPCSGRNVSFAQGRNRFRSASYFNTDFAVMKNTRNPHWETGVDHRRPVF